MGGNVTKVDEKNFDREVIDSRIPVVVDFYADWCGPCRIVSPILEKLSEEYNGRVKFVKVNTDENQGLTERYGIMSIPTIMIFLNGQIRDTTIGAAPSNLYKKKIDSILSEFME